MRNNKIFYRILKLDKNVYNELIVESTSLQRAVAIWIASYLISVLAIFTVFRDFTNFLKNNLSLIATGLPEQSVIELRNVISSLEATFSSETTFTDLITILNHFGCLNDLELTEVGQTVGAIRSENELWIGLVLVSGYLDDLDPPELAAIIQAICVDVRRPNLWCNFKPSLKVIDVFNELDGLRKLVSFQQNKFHIEIPIYLETELTGIISEWARGKKWKDLVFNTSLDEGDVVRIIRRTIDVLSQVQYCIGVSNKLKSKAKLALKAINRFPVSESNDLIKVSEDINPATKRINNNS